jgi:hypothetical protein
MDEPVAAEPTFEVEPLPPLLALPAAEVALLAL